MFKEVVSEYIWLATCQGKISGPSGRISEGGYKFLRLIMGLILIPFLKKNKVYLCVILEQMIKDCEIFN